MNTTLFSNSCPKFFPLPLQNGLSTIIPIYNQNITQPDLDCDEIIDKVDPDIDGDGVPNTYDAFPTNSLESIDTDNDGIGDNSDNYDNRLDDNKLLVYEDVDLQRGSWLSTVGIPKRIYSPSRGTGVAKIRDGILYKLALNNSKHNIIQWDISAKKAYSIYVKLKVKTIVNNKIIITNRIIHYYPNNNTLGLTKKDIYISV